MQANEINVSADSDLYFYQPSLTASRLFMYPMAVGHFYYLPGYKQTRIRYDSFLLLFINSGECFAEIQGKPLVGIRNQFMFLDCYQSHKYSFPIESEVYWIHFDGPLARSYYETITASKGNTITVQSHHSILHTLKKILNIFRTHSPVNESVVSAYITQILTDLLYGKQDSGNKISSPRMIERSLAYINDHFDEQISLSHLAKEANLSPYYFTRVFTAETGFTPHQYIIAARINSAKYLLDHSDISVKDIAFSCGFNSESSFCTTFKKWENMTPSDYRSRIIP